MSSAHHNPMPATARAPATRRVKAPKVAKDAKADTATARSRMVGDWRRVADALHVDIIFGRLVPRERLVEDVLIERFGTSRHAVRSAIEEMHRRGLVEREPNRGACVRDYSRQDVEELFELLETLEAQAIRRMPLPLSDVVLTQLEQLQQAHEAAGRDEQPLEIFRLNKAFHDTLFGACGNARLASAIQSYAQLIDPIRMRRIPDAAWRREAAGHHRRMIALLRGTDHEALVALCQEHIEPTKHFYLSLYPQHAATVGV